jgi:phosphoglycerate dehydrogenase-like enzyme
VESGGERVLVVDLSSSARVWALPAEREADLVAAAPPGWRVRIVRSATVSDGDGADRPSDESLDAIRDADAYFGYGMSPTLFARATKLRWMHTASAGVGAMLFPAMIESDVQVTNSAGVHAIPIAEFVLGGVLMLMRGLHIAVDRQRIAMWDKQPFQNGATRVRELGESRALIVGTGGIGGEVATRFSALGARTVGIRRRPALGTPAGFGRVVGPEALDDELPHADVLVLAAPLTGSTRGVLDAERLALLPRDAIVVNVARGSLVDEAALVSALADGRLLGAVLDVFEQEPLPASSALWRLQNAIVSPHVSGVSPRRFWERELALFTDNWARHHAGAPLRNLVDKRAGY